MVLKLWATPWNLAHLGKSSASNHTAASTIPRTAIGITEVHLQLNTNRFSSCCPMLNSMTDYGRYQQPPQLFHHLVQGYVPRRNLPPWLSAFALLLCARSRHVGCREERLQNHSHLLWEERRLHLVRHDISSATRWFSGSDNNAVRTKVGRFHR